MEKGANMNVVKKCPICGQDMKNNNGSEVCSNCGDRYGEYYNFFAKAVKDFRGGDDSDKVIIECPGATIYDNSNTEVIRGVKWNNSRNFSQGFVIVDKPVYSPNHQPKRLVKKDKVNNICRCQACQDLTVRMRTHNNQKLRGEYSQDSPMMPKIDPGKDFSPMPDFK
jgi:hypothetical protein